jgi:hypothetical protein
MRREITHIVIDGRHRHPAYNGPEHYYRPCKRSTSTRNACVNEIEVYKVVTGTHTDHVSPTWVQTRIVEDSTTGQTQLSWWKQATSYSIAPLQARFLLDEVPKPVGS